MQEKLVTLLDDVGQVKGQTDLYSAHRHPAKFHLAVSVWLVRGHGANREILFQKRSREKIVGGDQWGNGICGNVRPDEDELGCAVRRLREEIGIEGVKLAPSYRFEYQVYSNEEYGEHELDQVYVGWYDGEFNLNPAEVQEIVWISLSELEEKIKKLPLIKAEETLGQSTLDLKNLTPPLAVQLTKGQFEIAPWTAIMLGDSRLWASLRSL